MHNITNSWVTICRQSITNPLKYPSEVLTSCLTRVNALISYCAVTCILCYLAGRLLTLESLFALMSNTKIVKEAVVKGKLTQARCYCSGRIVVLWGGRLAYQDMVNSFRIINRYIGSLTKPCRTINWYMFCFVEFM